jgi:protein-disulfide isomerase
MTRLTVPVAQKDHVQGTAAAPVTLVEYGDYECPYSGQAYAVVKQLQADLGGTLRFVFRNFPLSEIHPHALEAAEAAEAAGKQDKFWEMYDLLFQNQNTLENHSLVGFAYTLGLNAERFVEDAAAEQSSRKIHEDFWSGIRSGVNGTPTFFVNGKLHNGSYAYSELRAAIEQISRKEAVV